MTGKWFFRGLIVVTTILLALVIGLRWQLARRLPPLPILGTVPAFSLTDSRSQTVTLADLRGQVWVAGFIFTRCAGMCPIMSTRMSELPQDELRLVSFSVDPEHDTPAVLAEYARGYDADPDRWSFLTGPKTAIRTLATTGFHLAAEDGTADDNEPILHSSHLVLVDGDGQIRGYYDGLVAGDMPLLRADARRLRR